MDLDEQISFMEHAAAWVPSPMRQAILASLRELKNTQAERDQLRARSKHLEKEAGELITQNDQLRARVAELEGENARRVNLAEKMVAEWQHYAAHDGCLPQEGFLDALAELIQAHGVDVDLAE